MIVQAMNLASALTYLYAYITKNIQLAKLVFYWLLGATLFQFVCFITDYKNHGVTSLVYLLIGAIFIYLEAIVVSYIQLSSIVRRLAVDQQEALEEWELFELREFIPYEDNNNKKDMRQPQPSNSRRKVMEKKDERKEYDGKRDWTKRLDFQSQPWNIQEIQTATMLENEYRKYLADASNGWNRP